MTWPEANIINKKDKLLGRFILYFRVKYGIKISNMSCFLSTTYWVFLFHILHAKYGIKRPNSLSFFFIILASELTIFSTKSCEKCPISYGKFQHDSPNGVASRLEKLMGVASTPLTGRGLTCRPIGMRSSASRSPSAVMHLRYRAFRHKCPFRQCRPSKQSAPDRCSVPLLFTWLHPCALEPPLVQLSTWNFQEIRPD